MQAQDTQNIHYRELAIEEYILTDEPFYLPVSDEIQLFEASYEQRIPVLLKGCLEE